MHPVTYGRRFAAREAGACLAAGAGESSVVLGHLSAVLGFDFS